MHEVIRIEKRADLNKSDIRWSDLSLTLISKLMLITSNILSHRISAKMNSKDNAAVKIVTIASWLNLD
jgi:hypothetical protein